MVEMATPMIMAINKMAIKSPAAKAPNRLLGTIFNNMADALGISGCWTTTLGRLKLFPGLKSRASDTPIHTAIAVVTA